MKIAIDASRLNSGVRTGTQNYLYHLIKELARIDNSNEYIVYFKDLVPKDIREGFEHGSNFRLRHLKTYFSWTQISLSLELLKNPPDILLAPWHTIPGIHMPSVRIVSTIHDITGNSFTTWYTAKFSNELIAVSKSTKKKLEDKFNINKKNINVVYEGFDRSLFTRRSEDEVESVKRKLGIRGRYILFVGTVGPRKNVKRMVRAFSKIAGEVKFVVAGSVDSDYAREVFELADSLNLEGELLFPGEVEQEDIAALYSGASVFAFASIEEGFGIPLLEAMACRVPVLTSNISSMPEVAGDAAYYADPFSVDSIYKGMLKLLEDSEFSYQLVETGVKRLEEFSWEKCALRTLEIFENVGGKL